MYIDIFTGRKSSHESLSFKLLDLSKEIMCLNSLLYILTVHNQISNFTINRTLKTSAKYIEKLLKAREKYEQV